jgi:hypothetical protein
MYKELRDLYSLTSIIRRMRWAGKVALMGGRGMHVGC